MTKAGDAGLWFLFRVSPNATIPSLFLLFHYALQPLLESTFLTSFGFVVLNLGMDGFLVYEKAHGVLLTKSDDVGNEVIVTQAGRIIIKEKEQHKGHHVLNDEHLLTHHIATGSRCHRIVQLGVEIRRNRHENGK